MHQERQCIQSKDDQVYPDTLFMIKNVLPADDNPGCGCNDRNESDSGLR